jgi:peptide/nickel transport system ATP-binding protein
MLSVRDLAVSYGRGARATHAVRGVSFDLSAGDTLGIAGESGCGKSTVAAAMLRILPANASVTGEILLDGEDVLTMRPGRMRAVRWAEMSIVFQGALHVMNPVRTVGYQVDEAVKLHEPSLGNAARRTRLVELFEQVGLSEQRLSAYPHQLSGGQRQRVMIAMALACKPQVLIADEPTTALDVMVQAQVLQLLARLQRELGMGLIFITHDLSVLAATSERLAVMYAGRFVENGRSAEVLRAPQHPYTRALVGAFPSVGATGDRFAPRGLAGEPPDLRDAPTACAFAPRCADAIDACMAGEPPLAVVDGRQVACVRVRAVV